MRIMISSSTYAPAMNGQAVFTTNLAEGLARLGHEVMVVIDSQHVHASHLVINGVQIEELRSISLNKFHPGVYFSPFPGREVKKLFDKFKPDVAHIQDHYPSCRVVAKVACERSVKLIGSNHFIPENLAPYIPLYSNLKPAYIWALWHWMLGTYKHLDVVTAQSHAAVRIIRRAGLQLPIFSISCGIDTQRYVPDLDKDRNQYRKKYGLDPDKIILLFLGRIDGEKRVDLLLQAMQQLDRDDTQLAIAGHGRVEKKLKRMAKKMNLQDRVIFTGFIPPDDKPGLLNSVDIFVMPSEAELLSISTLEAMACGRPVLLANALALPELVRDGENGYLFKPGNVKDLTGLIQELAAHPDRWVAMGKISREIAIEHDLGKTIQEFINLYSLMVSEAPLTEQYQPLRSKYKRIEPE